MLPEGSSLTSSCSCLSTTLLLPVQPWPPHLRFCCGNTEEGTKGTELARGLAQVQKDTGMHVHTQHICTHMFMCTHMHADPGFVWISSTLTYQGKNHTHHPGLVFSLHLVILSGSVFLDEFKRNLQGK